MKFGWLYGILLFASVASAETFEQAVERYLASDRPLHVEPRRYVAADDAVDGPWKKITVGLGVTVTDGNSDTVTAAFAGDAVREWGLWKLQLGAVVIYAESEGEETASEWIFTERVDRKITALSSLFQTLFVEHDEQESLRVRLRFTLGYSRRLINKDEFWLEADLGVGVLHEEFRPDTDDTEGIAQIGVRWEWKITKQLTYNQTIQIYPSLSEGGDFQMIWTSEFKTPIADRWNLVLTIVDTYDSDPPAGNKENDLKVILRLTVDFVKPKK